MLLKLLLRVEVVFGADSCAVWGSTDTTTSSYVCIPLLFFFFSGICIYLTVHINTGIFFGTVMLGFAIARLGFLDLGPNGMFCKQAGPGECFWLGDKLYKSISFY